MLTRPASIRRRAALVARFAWSAALATLTASALATTDSPPATTPTAPAPTPAPATTPTPATAPASATTASSEVRTTTVDVDLKDLSWFLVGDRADLLLRYFEQRHEWKVEVDGILNQMTVTGARSHFSGPLWYFGVLPLAPERPGKPAAFTYASPGQGPVAVNRRSSGGADPLVFAMLIVRDGFLAVGAADPSGDPELAALRKSLADAANILRTVRATIEPIPANTPDAAAAAIDALPRTPERRGTPTMAITGTNSRGAALTVEAWVNPRQRGTVIVGFRDAATNEELHINRNYTRARRIPWSTEADWLSSVTFRPTLVHSRIDPVDPAASPSPRQRDVIVEIRFTPDDGSQPPCVLISQRATLTL